MADWKRLPVSLTELCVNTTLRCGQSFRWRKSKDNVWSMALHGRILSLRQDSQFLHYRAIFPSTRNALATPPGSSRASTNEGEDDSLELIRHYLNLQPDLGQLYEQWAAADANFRKKAPKFTGIRILKQDAWEALIGFICSSNNNIARISQMVEKLCSNYGPLVGHIDGVPYHDYPLPGALVGAGVEQHLRQLGFGYRAKYIHQTAVMVHERGLAWLDGLRNPESPLLGHKPSSAGELVEGGREGYRRAHEQLLELQGVGPKVADCVCLMGLGWGEAVPVDTHVWQIAQRDYKFGKGKHSSLTKATYDAIGNKFRALWGQEAGWAHSVLFTADLRAFSERHLEKVEADATVAIKLEGHAVLGELKIEEDVKVSIKKEDADAITEVRGKEIKASRKRVKTEPGEEDHQVVQVEERSLRSVKRRRKS